MTDQGINQLFSGKPQESPIAAAVRADLLKRLERPLTIQGLRQLGRMVSAGIKVLRASAEGVEAHDDRIPRPRLPGLLDYPGAQADPDAVEGAEEPAGGLPPPPYLGGGAYAPSSLTETFGTSSFREIAAAVMKYINRPRGQDPDDLAEAAQSLTVALSEAKNAGLPPAVLAKLEGVLGRALEKVDESLKAGQDGGENGTGTKTLAPESVVVCDVPDPL